LPYIGNTPAEKYAAFNVQYFTTSATASYTLDRAVANELDIRLVINNVIQEPGSGKAYTASGTTLTLSAATAGSDTMYCVYIGKAVQTVNPGAGSVGTTALADNAVTEAKLNVSNSPTNGYVLSAQSGAAGGLTWAADAAGTITAFTNGVNNRVVTATSGTALNGEANLEFDGTDFKVLGKEFIGVVGSGGATTGKQTISFGSGEAMPQTLTAANSYIALGNNEYGDPSSANGKVMIAFGYTEGASLTNAPAYFGYDEELNSGKTKGALTFYTRSVTTDTAPTERMRVNSDGEVLIGTTGELHSGGEKLAVSGAGSSLPILSLGVTHTSVFGGVKFRNGNGEIGSVTYNASSVAYNTSSDYRLKENEVAISDGITRLKTLKPYKFNFKTDPDKTVDGFFAHEVSNVIPEAITGEKDDMHPEVLYTADDELPEGKEIGDVKEAAKPNHQGIDQSKLVPLLVAAVQELTTKVEALENA
jgi:hypothetical protein